MLTPIEKLALIKVPKTEAENARCAVKPGVYQVDFTIRVHGNIEVANDTSKKPTVSIPLKAVVGLLLQRAGATRESSRQLLVEVMQQALKEGKKAEDVFSKEVAVVDEAIKELTEGVIDKLPKTPVKGEVTNNTTIDIFFEDKVAA